jgi:hypothetical protein
VCQEHPSAAVSVQTEIIEDLRRILTRFSSVFEFLPCRRDDLAAGETPYWYHALSLLYNVITYR